MRAAYSLRMKLEIIFPAQRHLFEEPGALEQVAQRQAIGFSLQPHSLMGKTKNPKFVGRLCSDAVAFHRNSYNYLAVLHSLYVHYDPPHKNNFLVVPQMPAANIQCTI